MEFGLDGDGIITNDSVDSLGRKNLLTFIDEPNLYRCVFQSKKPNAKTFQDWIFNEVLPSLRKNGCYIMHQSELSNEELLAKAMEVATKVLADSDRRIAQQTQLILQQFVAKSKRKLAEKFFN